MNHGGHPNLHLFVYINSDVKESKNGILRAVHLAYCKIQ